MRPLRIGYYIVIVKVSYKLAFISLLARYEKSKSYMSYYNKIMANTEKRVSVGTFGNFGEHKAMPATTPVPCGGTLDVATPPLSGH